MFLFYLAVRILAVCPDRPFLCSGSFLDGGSGFPDVQLAASRALGSLECSELWRGHCQEGTCQAVTLTPLQPQGLGSAGGGQTLWLGGCWPWQPSAWLNSPLFPFSCLAESNCPLLLSSRPPGTPTPTPNPEAVFTLQTSWTAHNKAWGDEKRIPMSLGCHFIP